MTNYAKLKNISPKKDIHEGGILFTATQFLRARGDKFFSLSSFLDSIFVFCLFLEAEKEFIIASFLK